LDGTRWVDVYFLRVHRFANGIWQTLLLWVGRESSLYECRQKGRSQFRGGGVTQGWGQEARFAWFASWCEKQTFMFAVLGRQSFLTSFYVHVFGRPRDCLTGIPEKMDTFPGSRAKDSFAH
jgi:hypothetical protein